MTLENEKLALDVADIRIEPFVAEELIRAILCDIDDDRISARINDEPDFQIAAIRTTQNVVTMTTLAQTMRPTVPFKDLLGSRVFAAGDADLQAIGERLVEKIAQHPRIPDADISDELLGARYQAIVAAI